MRQRSPVGPSPRGASVGWRWRRDSAWPLRGERRSHHGGQRSRGRYTRCWWQLRWHWRWWHRSRGRHRRQSHASRRRRWHGVRQRWPWGQAVHQRRRRRPLHGRRAWREVRRSWGLLHFEVELKEELFGFPVPVRPKLSFCFVDFSAWHLESYGFVGLGCHQKVLPASIRRLNPLFIRGHEPMARHDAFCNLWIINLEEQALLACFWISLFGDFISRSSNFHKFLHFHFDFFWCRLGRSFLSFLGSSTGQIGLMLLPLGMC